MYSLVLLSCVFFVICALVNLIWFRPRIRSPLRIIPGPDLGHWLWGQYPNILKSPAGVPQRHWAEVHGPTVRIVGPLGIERLMVLSPSTLSKILVTDAASYEKPMFTQKLLDLTTGYGLLTAEGPAHHSMRRQLGPAFSASSVTSQHEIHYQCIATLVETLRTRVGNAGDPYTGVVCLMHELFTRLALDILTTAVLDYPVHALTSPRCDLITAYHNLEGTQSGINVTKFIALLSFPFASSFLSSKFAYRLCTNYWYKKFITAAAPLSTMLESMHCIRKTAEDIYDKKVGSIPEEKCCAEEEKHRSVFLSLLQGDRPEKSDGRLPNRTLAINQIMTFLTTGHETVANALSWTIWCLAAHPNIQDKLYSELRPLLSATGYPSYSDLQNLPYLDGIIHESLRLFPPIPTTFRKAVKDDWLDGFFVPKGTLLYVGILTINTRKETWGDDALSFRPERWPDAKSKIKNHTFLSFLAGPRGCIGKTMALLELKSTISLLAFHFTFDLAFDGQKPQPAVGITMTPGDGMPIRVRLRNDSVHS